MKIVILDGHAMNPGDLSWDCFRSFGELTYYDRTQGLEQTISRIADSDIVILNKVSITEEVLKRCPSIKLICILATGYNIVDHQAAARRGIPVCNVPGYSTDAVAQFTFALLLELCHRVGHHSHVVHGGKWSACPDFCFWDTPQMELSGKTMGIIGYGSIGRAVARLASAFGMKVIVHSRTNRGDAEYVDLEKLLSEADVVSLHCPLFPETEHMINSETISLMKDGAILLNAARGALVDEQAVADALRSGKLRGMAADVATVEPIPANSPLLGAPNCILTPHIAWAPLETRQRLLDITTQSIQAFLGGTPINTVNGF